MDRSIEPEEGPDESTTAPRRGRPRRYANAAEKQRAYRQRRAVRIAAQPKASTEAAPAPPRKLRTGRELLEELKASGLIGIWKDRTDIGDSVEFARRIRERAQTRQDRDGGAGLWADLKKAREERDSS
jgi:hypothetical protein